MSGFYKDVAPTARSCYGHNVMFAKSSCQHCNGHIEYDSTYEGVTVECPHCFEPTKLNASEIPKTPLEPKKLIISDISNTPHEEPKKIIILGVSNTPPESRRLIIPGMPDKPAGKPNEIESVSNDDWKDYPCNDDWKNDAMSEKQRAMLALYGVPISEGLTKGEASTLIDKAVHSDIRPTTETQAKAGEMFGHCRLQEIVEEMNRAIEVISDTTVTITTLKETKAKVRKAVRNFTVQIDRRIQTKQEENREVSRTRTSEWLRERGL